MNSRLNLKISLIFLVICLIIILARFGNLDSFLRSGLEQILMPLQEQFSSLGIKNSPAVTNDNLDLLAKIASLEKENGNLRKLLGAPLPSKWHFLPAKIIGKDGDDYIIDQGKVEGVLLEQVVLDETDFAGKISFVGENISRFSSFNNPNLKISVYFKNPKEEAIEGRGLLRSEAGKIIIDQILTEEKVTIGDLVFTAGENYIPADILIGTISNVGKISSVFQKAEVFPQVDQATLQNVFLVNYK